MSDLFQFLGAHPWPGCLAGCLVLTLSAWLLVVLATLACRATNILVRGWPPKHLDADGDFKKTPEANTETEPAP